MDRRGICATIGAALITFGGAGVVGWLLGYKAAELPLWPIWIFGAALLVGVFLGTAAVLGLPPSGHDLPPGHEEQLRQIVTRVRGLSDQDNISPYHTDYERKMFEAHYPRLHQKQEVVRRAAAEESNAWATLSAEIPALATQRFPPREFWTPNAFVEVARWRLKDQAGVIELAEDEIECTRGTVEGQEQPPTLSWRGNILWWPTRESAEARRSDAELAQMVVTVREAFAQLSDSEAAKVYRDALLEVREYRSELATELVPILHHEQIRWCRRCPICRPNEHWR